MQNNIVDTLLPPLTAGELVLAYAGGGLTRGLTVGCAVTLAMSLFVNLSFNNLTCIAFYAIAGSLMLSLLGIIGGIWADRHDHMTVISGFIITPLSFLSGTFYSIHRLPETIQTIALFNPFFYAIDGIRAGFIGQADGSLPIGAAFIIFINIALWLLCQKMLASGYKLRP